VRRFGTWTEALRSFVNYANGAEPNDEVDPEPALRGVGREERDGARFPGLRLRFRVLQADRFACRACGASQATDAAVSLQVDHIEPWSRGGRTAFENLQTLCRRCNSGKGDLQG